MVPDHVTSIEYIQNTTAIVESKLQYVPNFWDIMATQVFFTQYEILKQVTVMDINKYDNICSKSQLHLVNSCSLSNKLLF